MLASEVTAPSHDLAPDGRGVLLHHAGGDAPALADCVAVPCDREQRHGRPPAELRMVLADVTAALRAATA